MKKLGKNKLKKGEKGKNGKIEKKGKYSKDKCGVKVLDGAYSKAGIYNWGNSGLRTQGNGILMGHYNGS